MATYSDIVTAIEAAANEVNPDGRFLDGRKIDVSQSFDGAYPLINLYPFITQQDNGGDNDTSNILLGFWVQDTPETTPLERRALITAMDELSDAFKDALNESKVLQMNDFKKEPQYQFYSGTLSGYAVSFKLITKASC